MLFFSGVLFISLAVCVHLTPHFPAISDLVTSVSSVVVFDHRVSCINLVNEIVWDMKPKNWDWAKTSKVSACKFQKLSKLDASDLLNGSWVVVSGDSQARLVAFSLLNLVLGSDSKSMESVRGDLFKRHSDHNLQFV
ncbi:hypothetical protein SLE2022_315720 [Rubroshorea leprosula]